MTTIQWEEDWFTVLPGDKGGKAEKGDKGDKGGNPTNELQEIHRRLEALSLLVQQQSQQITLLTQELQELKQQQPTEEKPSAATQIADLLEELKRVKERELNYALRRHVAVPFFDSGMLQRMAGLDGVKPPRSPLFRGATATKGPSL